ncbi:MAG: dctM [Alphaproteobacteria bacterium]|jgi:TRAP-type C4-dicarboxylate transport system permease small subunit|nr:dctM [Alphaproteobacteria bacterium]
MDRLVYVVERIAACFLGLVVLLTVSTIVLRATIGWQIPDWFQFACIAQAIAIFWGLAPATYSNNHILFDVLWEALGPRGRQALDVFAALVSVGFLAVLAYMLGSKVDTAFTMHDVTTDLRLATWPFYLVAMFGIVMAAALGLLRLVRLLTGQGAPAPRPLQLD